MAALCATQPSVEAEHHQEPEHGDGTEPAGDVVVPSAVIATAAVAAVTALVESPKKHMGDHESDDGSDYEDDNDDDDDDDDGNFLDEFLNTEQIDSMPSDSTGVPSFSPSDLSAEVYEGGDTQGAPKLTEAHGAESQPTKAERQLPSNDPPEESQQNNCNSRNRDSNDVDAMPTKTSSVDEKGDPPTADPAVLVGTDCTDNVEDVGTPASSPSADCNAGRLAQNDSAEVAAAPSLEQSENESKTVPKCARLDHLRFPKEGGEEKKEDDVTLTVAAPQSTDSSDDTDDSRKKEVDHFTPQSTTTLPHEVSIDDDNKSVTNNEHESSQPEAGDDDIATDPSKEEDVITSVTSNPAVEEGQGKEQEQEQEQVDNTDDNVDDNAYDNADDDDDVNDDNVDGAAEMIDESITPLRQIRTDDTAASGENAQFDKYADAATTCNSELSSPSDVQVQHLADEEQLRMNLPPSPNKKRRPQHNQKLRTEIFLNDGVECVEVQGDTINNEPIGNHNTFSDDTANDDVDGSRYNVIEDPSTEEDAVEREQLQDTALQQQHHQDPDGAAPPSDADEHDELDRLALDPTYGDDHDGNDTDDGNTVDDEVVDDTAIIAEKYHVVDDVVQSNSHVPSQVGGDVASQRQESIDESQEDGHGEAGINCEILRSDDDSVESFRAKHSLLNVKSSASSQNTDRYRHEGEDDNENEGRSPPQHDITVQQPDETTDATDRVISIAGTTSTTESPLVLIIKNDSNDDGRDRHYDRDCVLPSSPREDISAFEVDINDAPLTGGQQAESPAISSKIDGVEHIEVSVTDNIFFSAFEELGVENDGVEVQASDDFSKRTEDQRDDADAKTKNHPDPPAALSQIDPSSLTSLKQIAVYFATLEAPAGAASEDRKKIRRFQKLVAAVVNGEKPTIIEAAQIRQAAQRANISLGIVDHFLEYAAEEEYPSPGEMPSMEDVVGPVPSAVLSDLEVEGMNEDEAIAGFLNRFQALRQGGHFHEEPVDDPNASMLTTPSIDDEAIEVDAQVGFVQVKNAPDEEEEWWRASDEGAGPTTRNYYNDGSESEDDNEMESEGDGIRGRHHGITGTTVGVNTDAENDDEKDDRNGVTDDDNAAGRMQQPRQNGNRGASSSAAPPINLIGIDETHPVVDLLLDDDDDDAANDITGPSANHRSPFHGSHPHTSPTGAWMDDRTLTESASFAYDHKYREEASLWARKNSMALYGTAWEKHKRWVQGRSSSTRDPVPIDGVAAANHINRFSYKRSLLPVARPWRLSYKERTKQHSGYFDIDVYSIYETSAVGRQIEDEDDELDYLPWESRDVRQRFLHEKSISLSRNWYGDNVPTLGNDRLKQPVCKPKSMEMPIENIPHPGEWTEEWYTTWKSPSEHHALNSVQSDDNDSETRTYDDGTRTYDDGTRTYDDGTRTYIDDATRTYFDGDTATYYQEDDDQTQTRTRGDGSTTIGKSLASSNEENTRRGRDRYYEGEEEDDVDDDDEDDYSWEDPPECGVIINIKQKIGERISRVHPSITSSLRRSRWRKKYFPQGTFPYK